MFFRTGFVGQFLYLVSVLCCLTASARADVSIESVAVGVGQVTRPGAWTRLKVQLQSTEATDCRVEVVAADPVGNQATFPSADVRLAPQTSSNVSVFFVPGRLGETVTVNVITTDGQLAASKRLKSARRISDAPDFVVVRHSVPVWAVVGTVGSRQKGKSNQQALQKAWSDRGIHFAQLDSTGELPDHWRGLSAITTVILSGSFDLTEEQSTALSNWVLNGGDVVVIAGTRIDELTSSPIADWVLHGREVTESSLFDLSGLEAFAKSSFRIPIAGRIKGCTIDIQDGHDVVKGLEGPLLTRSAHGFGRITILGVDVDRSPLSRWRALDSFMSAVADLPAEDVEDQAAGQRISHSGITELATQLQMGMETIPGVENRSTLTVLGLVLLFLVVIGPLDYYLVHRLFRKPGLTWLTFPSIVIAAGMIVSAVAGGANGIEIRSKICDLTDLDIATGFARQTVWASVYSPEHHRYRVQINHIQQLAAEDSSTAGTDTGTNVGMASTTGWLKWAAAPESNYGGMYRPAGLSLNNAGYTFFEGASGIQNLPIPAASDRILTSSSTYSGSPELFELNLKQSGTGHLSRESTFIHHLPTAIDDWLLVYGNRVYYHDNQGRDLLGSSAIESGVAWSAAGKTTGGRELRSFLTGSTFQETETKGIGGGAEFEFSQVDWNRRETDLQTIIRMVTFYQLAGGQDYTGVEHDALSELELSDSLPLDRAILFGRLKRPGASVQVDGQALAADREDSFIRVLLPVEDVAVKRSLPKFDD